MIVENITWKVRLFRKKKKQKNIDKEDGIL